MNRSPQVLSDEAARRTALIAHDRSLLVEAGAGSGKTAIMAGRIAMMLAEGIAPKAMAAVTFTELAASELVMRVREFVQALGEGDIPTELQIALPHGLSQAQQDQLQIAAQAIDDITCSTIHGFCQRLIKPYPVEANIDPGAHVMDRNQADRIFKDVVDAWLRERLSDDQGGLIAEMVLQHPDDAVALIHRIANCLCRHRTVSAVAAAPLPALVQEFQNQASAFRQFLAGLGQVEADTERMVDGFEAMAREIAFALSADDPASLMRLLVARPHEELRTATGAFLQYRKKGNWGKVAQRTGLAKADGDRLNHLATDHYQDCCAAWNEMQANVASRVLAEAVAEARPVLQCYRKYKRGHALLDFDDLILTARDLLCDHDEVRQALARRYVHVLVDEFQDTDPLQVEIFWRLGGEAAHEVARGNWTEFTIRPGALFLVGDPKQAIYRFRGADVDTYGQAREAFRTQDADSIVSISTNFRSVAPILDYVNQRFEEPLSREGQPGFTALDSFHAGSNDAAGVVALDVAVADENDKASAAQRRDGEARAVADLCARLIGSEPIADRKTGQTRPCQAGDIALLAPTGRDLWRYEEELERKGVPVATQAGKGLFRRQEIQDLIALTRALADRRDSLALGALLRGPLVGLTEEELLDIVWALPRSPDDPDALPRLDLFVDPKDVSHALAQDMLAKLQGLGRDVNATTPHHVLSQAVDVLRVRPMLRQRHGGQAERALANVDLYLSLARAYGVQGLRGFAEAMATAWKDESRAVEGRPDAQEQAVALYTMHAAKGLEWPIVIPVNTMTLIMKPDDAFHDRQTNRFYSPVFGVAPTDYDEVREAEKRALAQERIRLWYVTTTRARELLVIPRLNVDPGESSWLNLLDLSLANLPAIDRSHLPAEPGTAAAPPANAQDRETFRRQAEAIVAQQPHLVWLSPSRDEDVASPVTATEEPDIVLPAGDGELLTEALPGAIQGSRERGAIMHKLFEEVLTGETDEELAALTARAVDLIEAQGKPVVADPQKGLSPDEIADCITHTLGLPEIAAWRPTLAAEFTLYACEKRENEERVTVGIADAVSFGADGVPQGIIDWKSDVDPQPKHIEHYQAQVRGYLSLTGLTKGLIVFVTTGAIVEVC